MLPAGSTSDGRTAKQVRRIHRFPSPVFFFLSFGSGFVGCCWFVNCLFLGGFIEVWVCLRLKIPGIEFGPKILIILVGGLRTHLSEASI
jgi:hypothetical protein